MDPIKFSIQNPVKVAVGVLLLLLFGVAALLTIPVQLTPNVDQPVITVNTRWTGRSPQEVEREIVEEQEEKLKSVSGLREMIATAAQGEATIELEFYVGTDLTRALQEVSDKLREVPDYPDDVDQPVITAADSASENAIAWMVLQANDPDYEMAQLFDAVDQRVKPVFERIVGVSEVNVYGGREQQVHVQINPAQMAARGVTFNQLQQALRLENVNISAGELTEGRLDVRVRTVGQYEDLSAVEQTIVAESAGGPIRVRDIADVTLALEKRRSFVRARGQPALAINAIRESGSNVINIMEQLRDRIEVVNRDVLPGIAAELDTQEPIQLELKQVYDETVYIYKALTLVQNNLWLGGTLAVLALLLYLRRIRPTMIVALVIPSSVIGTFVVMAGFGRNLNVISIAGLAFAVGMVIDNAIVVLENIDRHQAMGKPTGKAAYDAAREVWGAILASTLTTVAVFVPVLTIQEEAGQLFRDISLAIVASVLLSLTMAITVIPSASSRFLHKRPLKETGFKKQAHTLFGLTSFFGKIVGGIAELIYRITAPTPAMVGLRLGIVAGVTVGAVAMIYWLMPPTTYLPRGNRNLVFAFMLNPPGYSMQQNQFIGERIEEELRPYWQSDTMAETAQLPPAVGFDGQAVTPPPIDNFFFVSFGGGNFMGASSAEEEIVAPLATLLNQSMGQIPGSMGFAQQSSIFGRGIGGSNAIDVNVSGSQLDQVVASAGAIHGALMQRYGPQSTRPTPANYSLPGPEVQVTINRTRAAELGVDVASLGLGVQALVDGSIVGDFRLRGDSIDILMVRHPDFPLRTNDLAQVPVAWRIGDSSGVIPLSAIAEVRATDAPQEIRRIEELRTVTLTFTPPDEVALEEASSDVAAIAAQLREQGAIPPTVDVHLAGTADKLTEVREAMIGRWTGLNFESLQSFGMSRMFLALLITYLLMAALFESFLYPFVIMFSVPLAAVGGFLGLAIVHYFVPTQLLDVLTMLGFVILIGIVVNNAILLVHQALNFMRGEGETDVTDPVHGKKLQPREAIREAVRTRVRPIAMTTTTSLLGMLPLVVMPGSGSELYRGLGGVVLGGLLVSTAFTLVIVPLVFSLAMDARQLVTGRAAKGAQVEEPVGV